MIGADLGVSTGVGAWAISLYALMLAVATAVYGRISDLVGVRLPLLVGVALMAAGALAGALAPNFGMLLVARIVQGAGAAAVPTLGVAIVTRPLHRRRRRARARPGGRLRRGGEPASARWPAATIEGLLGWRAVIALPVLGLLLVPLLCRAMPDRRQRRPARPVRRRPRGADRRRRRAAGAVAVDRPARGRRRRGCWPCSAYRPSRRGYAVARTASCRSR